MRATGLFLALVSLGCSTRETAPTAKQTTSAAKTSATAATASHSPFHVVLESKSSITVAGLTDGVWISEGPGKRVAQAAGDGALSSGPAPPGLPDQWARILNVSGLLAHPWLSLELDEKGENNLPKTPLYRFDGKEFRRIDENWRPLVTVWSKGRPLAIWHSAGVLKAKVPLRGSDEPDDLPGAGLDDERCVYNLRFDELAGLPTGEVFALGRCTPTGASGERSVMVQWPMPEQEPTARPAATAQPSATAAAEASAAPTAAATARPSATPTGAPGAGAMAGAVTPPEGPPPAEIAANRGHVVVLPGLERALSHRSLVALSAKDVLVGGVDLEAKPEPTSYLWRFDGVAFQTIELPGPDEVRGVAQTNNGTLWLVTDTEIWTQAKGKWARVAPPGFGSAAAKPSFSNVYAFGDTVWISAELGEGGAVVLRNKPSKQKVTW